MHYKLNNLSMALLVLFGISACDSSDDPSLARVNVQLKAVTTQSTINPNGKMAAIEAITYTEFLAGVTELELEFEDDDLNDDDDDIEFEGRYVVDLLSGTSNPDFGISNLSPGIYDEVELEMEPILSGNKTLSIKALFMNNGQEIPVEFSTDSSFDLEIEDDDGIDLSEGSLRYVFVTLNIDILFNGVDLSSASIDEDGVIRINKNSNSAIASRIEGNVDDAFDAYDDDEDDDDDDDDEDDDDD
jgi:hypothetical protein